MLNNLIYSLNATVPVFIVILAGYILKEKGWIKPGFVTTANKINFKILLPALLIQDLMATNIRENFSISYILYCMAATIICILVIWALARAFIKDKSIVGAFTQGSYRGSVAVLGIAMVTNLYGDSGVMPLILISAVPIYNFMAVIILMIEADGGEKKSAGTIVKGIITNPIIDAIIIGTILSIFRVDFPTMIDSTIGNFAKMATPLALLAIGAGFEGKKAIAKIRPTIIGTCIKLIIQPLVFLPVAIAMGFRDAYLIAAVIMLGSPTTPSCYIMAKSMGNDEVLTSSMIVTTTMLSAFTITGIIFILKSVNLV
ncbi:MAG: AEC family transporter [Eubacterium sp.]